MPEEMQRENIRDLLSDTESNRTHVQIATWIFIALSIISLGMGTYDLVNSGRLNVGPVGLLNTTLVVDTDIIGEIPVEISRTSIEQIYIDLPGDGPLFMGLAALFICTGLACAIVWDRYDKKIKLLRERLPTEGENKGS